MVWNVKIVKTLRLGLLAISGWAITPVAWANSPEPQLLKETAPQSAAIFVNDPATRGDERRFEPSSKQLPATTVKDWMAQIEASLVQITGVRLEETETGLQVVLETADGTLTTPTTMAVGNALTAEIPNAVLVLPEGNAFEVVNPAPGISRVSVTSVSGDQVRVEIAGTDAPPTAEITSSASGLTFAVIPSRVDTAEEDAEVEITVTAEQAGSDYFVPEAGVTRTDTPILDTPASVFVIPRQIFEDQGITKFSDALRTTPGVSQTSAPNANFNNVNIRGFDVSSLNLRNGIPESFFTLSPPRDLNNVEQLEVLSGPASVIGYALPTSRGSLFIVGFQS